MVLVPRVLLVLSLSLVSVLAQETNRFRIWLAGQEVGGRELRHTQGPGGARIDTREWIRFDRLGMAVEQRVDQSVQRGGDGSLQFSWSILLAQEPLEGQAFWAPGEPLQLRIQAKNQPERVVKLEPGRVLWPGEQDARLREAARLRRPLSLKGYLPAMQQATELELEVIGPDPLPGFPGAVRFKGRSQEGSVAGEIEVWVAPETGEVKETGSLGGMPFLIQRAELPGPAAESSEGLFAQTLNALPPHPFLPWMHQATLRWEGQGEQRLPEDEQQKGLGPGRIRVQRALPPSAVEARQLPVKGPGSPEEAPFLEASPLVPFRDPRFDGLVARMRPPAGASRWELAQRVNRFVFDWITEKDFTVGFATALEVARSPKGDCTEHGILAVALLRRLGVPARGAMGWVGAGGLLGLHFWVEVKLGSRWIPIDPTFDEAPASALRLKLGTTDLADLGSVGWDTAATQFAGGRWVPEGDWTQGVQVSGDRVQALGGGILKLPGAAWKLEKGRLFLVWKGAHPVEAVPHPTVAQRQGCRLLQSQVTGRRGWWDEGGSGLWVSLNEGRWLRVADLDARSASDLLDHLEQLSVH